MGDYGSRIKAAREAANMTQEQLGTKVGVTGVTIMRYEKGQREPTQKMLLELATALKVTVGYLLGYESIGTRAIIDALSQKDPRELERLLGLDDNSIVDIASETATTPTDTTEKTIVFNATPDPEWSELERKLIDNTITPEELARYKELLTQGMANAHRAISAAKMRLSEYMDILNAKGQQIAVERVEELTKIPDYQRTEGK